MKRTICLSSILLSLPFAWLPPVASAQNAPTVTVTVPDVDVQAPRKTEPTRGVPIAPTPVPTGKDAQADSTSSKNPKSLPKFGIRAASGRLDDTIDLLQKELEAINLPRLNILFGPDCESVQVPPVNLYNVTGPDALLLIAAAADCVAQPIHSMDAGGPEQQKVVGYRIQKNPMAHASVGAMPGMGSEGGFEPFANPLAVGAPTTPPPLSPPGGMPPGALGMMGGAEMSPAPKVWEVRVYALGGLNEFLPKEKIMKTLTEVLDNVGAQKAGVDAKFHDNSNILIVRAPAETQRLVTELLAALEQNAAKGTYKEPPYGRDPVPPPVPRKVVPPTNTTTEVPPSSEPRKD